MRPVDRGLVPRDPAGKPKVYAQYADARADLITRLGRYCSFCERSIRAGLAVEHVRPKVAHPELECEWTNFLLACVNCNSTKSDKEVYRKRLFLPDQDNTFRVLAYKIGGRVEPASGLSATLKAKATRLIRLVGLDTTPIHDPQAKDLRWNDRREAWDKAERYRQQFDQGKIGTVAIVELCQADGHWSIWMTAFAGVNPVRSALVQAFPGTLSAQCFDGQGNPISRPGGQA